MTALLEVENLVVDIPVAAGMLHPVRGISFSVEKGKTLCIVGESGCGKSLTSLALMNLLPRTARRSADRITFQGEDISALPESRMWTLRGATMSMIFQEPMTSLNPTYTIGNQLEEAWLRHKSGSRADARDRAVFLLEKVGITAARNRLKQYPHQLSGGLRQRVMIAMALMCGPALIIADEPTTALDVTIQAQILHLLAELQHELDTGMILITHDLGIVARVADDVAVMYAGEIVEQGESTAVFNRPMHPYTQGLLRCIPIPGKTKAGELLGSIPGIVPNLVGEVGGCMFRNRCAYARDDCATADLPMTAVTGNHGYRCVLDATTATVNADDAAAWESNRVLPHVHGLDSAVRHIAQDVPVLETRDVECVFRVSQGLMRAKKPLHAVNGLSLKLERGSVLGLVGESGCGKTTFAKMLLGLERPTGGEILIDGEAVSGFSRRELARRIQPIFQDPYSSLNAAKTIRSIVSLPLRTHGIGDPADWNRKVEEMLDLVGLPRRVTDLYPSQLSGGQRQRVAIARALVMHPEVVICDEPTSALDVSVQSQILNLLQLLQKELNLTYLLISHNLAVVEHMADRVAVMYLGRIVEQGETTALFKSPQHPYTQALLESVLTPEPELGVPDAQLGATFPNPIDPPSGCTFHPRCPKAMPSCSQLAPVPVARDSGGEVECHLYSAPDQKVA